MNKESQQAVRKHTCAGGSSTFSWSFKFGWNVQFLSLFLFQIITSKTFLIIFSVKTFLNFSTLKMTSQFNARSLIHEMKNYYKILLWTKINTLIKSIFTYLMFENVKCQALYHKRSAGTSGAACRPHRRTTSGACTV